MYVGTQGQECMTPEIRAPEYGSMGLWVQPNLHLYNLEAVCCVDCTLNSVQYYVAFLLVFPLLVVLLNSYQLAAYCCVM